jgi:hypothetical protein
VKLAAVKFAKAAVALKMAIRPDPGGPGAGRRRRPTLEVARQGLQRGRFEAPLGDKAGAERMVNELTT